MIDLGTLYMKVEANTDKATKSLKNFGASVDGTKNKLAILDKRGMAVARGAFLALSAAVVAGTAAALKFADAISKVGDEIAKSAKRCGMAVERYQTLRYAFNLCGISANTLEKATRKLYGSEWEGNIEGAISHLQSIEDQTKRDAEAQKIFGNRLAQSMKVLIDCEQSVADYNAQMKEYGYWTDEATKASEDYQDALTNWNQAMTGLKSIVAEELLPVMTELIESLAKWIGSHQEQIHNFFEGLGLIFQFLAKHGEAVTAVMLGVAAALMVLSGPVGIITLAIVALVAAITALIVHWDEIKARFKKELKAIIDSGPVQRCIEVVKTLINWWNTLDKKLSKTLHANVTTKAQDAGLPKRIGLREVPYDNYPALLHKGETILTAAETNQYRKYINGELPNQAAVAQAVPDNAVFNLYIDGRKFAEMTAPYMSEQINTNLRRANRKLGVV